MSETYRDLYAGMTDDQLLSLARSIDTLVSDARAALGEELSARELGAREFHSYISEISNSSVWHQMAQLEPVTYVINGFGTMFYGKRDFWPDRSYTTTKFAVVLFVPVFPLKSFRVRKLGPAGPWSTSYIVSSESPLSIRQVVYIYSFIAGVMGIASGLDRYPILTLCALIAWSLVPTLLRRTVKTQHK